MKTILGILVLCLTLPAAVSSAILVNSDNDGRSSQLYFDDGSLVLVEEGQLRFGMDRDGGCWFIDRGTRVVDSCQQMLDLMHATREQALAGFGPQERALMQHMIGAGRSAVPAEPVGKEARTIAGYRASCYALGDSREVCVSTALMDVIQREMRGSRFTELMRRFRQSAAMMAPDPADNVLATLYERGYPMYDMQTVTVGIPGLNPAMLQQLPAAQRAQILQQFGGAGAGAVPKGTRVTAVQKDVPMPAFDLATYPQRGFQEYLRATMGGMPGTR